MSFKERAVVRLHVKLLAKLLVVPQKKSQRKSADKLDTYERDSGDTRREGSVVLIS